MSRNPLLDLLAALLPAQERSALVRHGAEPLVWSVLLGLVEFFVGGSLIVSDAMAWFQPMADAAATRIMEMDPRELAASPDNKAVGHVGAVIWVAFGVTREVVGEPLVWAAVRIAQAARRLLHGSQDLLRFGPERPDRLLHEAESDLIVLSARPKLEWNERVTIEIDERFYRLRRTEERQDGTWWAYAYLLREAEPGEIIRALVRYR
jgi:hypothetical protein